MFTHTSSNRQYIERNVYVKERQSLCSKVRLCLKREKKWLKWKETVALGWNVCDRDGGQSVRFVSAQTADGAERFLHIVEDLRGRKRECGVGASVEIVGRI